MSTRARSNHVPAAGYNAANRPTAASAGSSVPISRRTSEKITAKHPSVEAMATRRKGTYPRPVTDATAAVT
jgi:hypothetical protein